MMRYTARSRIYRRTPTGANAEGQATFTWTLVASDVQCRGQGTGSGGVAQDPSGRIATATHWFLFPTGTDLQADDGIEVTAVNSGAPDALVGGRYLVDKSFDWGGAGGVQVDANTTLEAFA